MLTGTSYTWDEGEEHEGCLYSELSGSPLRVNSQTNQSMNRNEEEAYKCTVDECYLKEAERDIQQHHVIPTRNEGVRLS